MMFFELNIISDSRLLALPAIIRLGSKSLSAINTLAYLFRAEVEYKNGNPK
jgi:hypothetical protein